MLIRVGPVEKCNICSYCDFVLNNNENTFTFPPNLPLFAVRTVFLENAKEFAKLTSAEKCTILCYYDFRRDLCDIFFN